MAIVKKPNPSTVPTVPNDYFLQNDKASFNALGKSLVTLTNWDSTITEPQITIGSLIEDQGVYYEATGTESIVVDGSLSSGTIYVCFNDATPGYEFTNTVPVWSATLGGYYCGTRRFTGHLCTWNGTAGYYNKRAYLNNTQYGGDSTITYDSYIMRTGGVILEWFHINSSYFSTPSTSPAGIAFDGTNIISCDSGTNLIYIHNGLTSSVSSSFAAPGTGTRQIVIIGGNLISGEQLLSDLISVHSGITTTVSSSFAAPGGALSGLTTDGTNLISCDSGTNLIYIHTGVTSSITSSFASPGSAIGGLAYDGTNLISFDNGTNSVYIHDGISADILGSFAITEGGEMVVIGRNLVVIDPTTDTINFRGV